ncbi:MAG: glucose-6-phosphate dehydrogenase [Imperialibacter sp.]|uniref:glucose-6-phosphate dehydrogenase n=1 Tax=Imperialibacter sp. TaxID=2038411 RepID=UPI0032EB24AA
MKKTDNQILTIFGASGDLTERKLIPAVFNLFKRGFLPENYAILGVSRTDFSDEEYRKKVVFDNPHLKASKEKPDELESFAKLVFYQSIDTKAVVDYQLLANRLKTLCNDCHTDQNYIFYLSTPPSLYSVISKNLGEAQLNTEEKGWKRLIVEKPFGYTLESAKELNNSLLESFKEDQIYRIDHYLGKETVQNTLVARFGNTIFEPLWNRIYIEKVEITAAESVGVEKRGGYYDGSGALRDMIQNHLLQLVSLVTMEPPARMDAESIHNEKLKLFRSLRPLSADDIRNNVIRGQYLNSTFGDKEYLGYRDEQGVDAESRTETFAALKFYIDNWRWADVPFFVRTGKRLPTRVSEVVIHFKPNHHHLFSQRRIANSQNVLVFRIQPNEGILLKFGLKVPGNGFKVETVNMDFQYDGLTDAYVPEAYERLLLDCMQGDATLYARGDSVIAAWEFVDPILKAWKDDPDLPVYGYPSGTWGPEQANTLIENGHGWRNPCANLVDDGLYCEL